MALSADLFSGLGSAVGDLFGGAAQFSAASGYKIAAKSYLDSADFYGQQSGVYDKMGALSGENAKIAATSSRLQQVQQEREITKVLGGQQSDIAASGLMNSGSALDIIRSSTQQGSLQLSALRQQGALDQQGYREEALSFGAMSKASLAAKAAATGQAGMNSAQASAAKKSGIGGILGGALKIGASVLPLLSDQRAKRNITFMDRRDDGIGHYLFQYLDAPDWYIGVLAQEVHRVYPEAVTLDAPSGYYKVDYAMIGDAMYHVGNC